MDSTGLNKCRSILKIQISLSTKGPFIKDVIDQGGGGLPKYDLTYLISLFSKSDDDVGRGVKNFEKLMTSFINGP